ncbi:metal-sensing transcriptional repressor [Streptomyces sp. NPDC057854]|uniref:metal-sensing transcriptional repressor n=1 Tax=unclassified Streptomyces TaxID=2593676 RepID=UPI0036C21769
MRPGDHHLRPHRYSGSGTGAAPHGYAEHKSDHLARLHKIEGQVRGLLRMVGEVRYCLGEVHGRVWAHCKLSDGLGQDNQAEATATVPPTGHVPPSSPCSLRSPCRPTRKRRPSAPMLNRQPRTPDTACPARPPHPLPPSPTRSPR